MSAVALTAVAVLVVIVTVPIGTIFLAMKVLKFIEERETYERHTH